MPGASEPMANKLEGTGMKRSQPCTGCHYDFVLLHLRQGSSLLSNPITHLLPLTSNPTTHFEPSIFTVPSLLSPPLQKMNFLNSNFIEIKFICHKIHPFKVYNSKIIFIVTKLFKHYRYIILEHFYDTKKKSYTH